MSLSNESKSCMRVNKNSLARVCMKVFLTFMSRSNKNKSCMTVGKQNLHIYMHNDS